MAKPPLPPDREASPRHKTHPKSKSQETAQKQDTLRSLTQTFDVDIQSQFKETIETSDRSSAILLSSLVERILEFTIAHRLPRQDPETLEKLKDRDGPLNGFFSKIYLAYALGIIPDDVRDELDAIRRIRNTFAHSALRIDFETPAILEECKKFKRTIDLSTENIDEAYKKMSQLSESRIRFSVTCITITMYLFVRLVQPKHFDSDSISEEGKRTIEGVKKWLNIPDFEKRA